jgi:hypothetical protein
LRADFPDDEAPRLQLRIPEPDVRQAKAS